MSTLLGPVAGRAQSPSWGPLTYEEGSPLHRVALTPTTEDAALVPRGSLSVSMWLGYSNIFEQDSTDTHVLFIDMERLASTVTLRWGVADRLELGGRVLLETTGGGALDGLIVGWHEAWGFGQANRDQFPEGQYAQRLADGDGRVFVDIPRSTLAFEDARLFAKALVARSRDGGSALSLRAETRIPGATNRAATERVDFALAALGRLRLGSWYVHTLLGGSTIRASPELDPILRDATTFLTVALERSFGPFSGVAQYQVQSPVLTTFDHREIDRSPSNLVLGLSGGFGDRWSWDASFQEDLPADTPAIDFTFGLRITRHW